MRAPLFSIRKLHFIGIGGIGMSGIAEVLHNLGYSVQGSDISENANVKRLRKLGIEVFIGHQKDNLTDAQVVVVSSAIKEDNPELIEARQNLLPIVKRAEMLAELMRLKWGISIAGTHGKTTTTSLVANLLDTARFDPTVINGGIINTYGSNARLGLGEWIIVEADESDGSFQKLPSTICVITNIDQEHMDYYDSFEELKQSFVNFAERIPFYGLVVLCSDHKEVRSIIPQLRDRRVITYGFRAEADVRGVNVQITAEGARFDVEITDRARRHWNQASEASGRDMVIKDLFLPMVGVHNVQNALSVIAIAQELSISEDVLRQSLSSFGGVKRRFTKTGEVRGITIIDDYAHHPVEISAVLDAARLATKGKITVVVQPHRYSRLYHLFEDFCSCFGQADRVIVAPIYSAGEMPIENLSAATLAEGIRKNGHPCVFEILSKDELPIMIHSVAQKGDIVICVGAGDITNWANALPAELEKFSS